VVGADVIDATRWACRNEHIPNAAAIRFVFLTCPAPCRAQVGFAHSSALKKGLP
jgi:hypothetical protein